MIYHIVGLNQHVGLSPTVYPDELVQLYFADSFSLSGICP